MSETKPGRVGPEEKETIPSKADIWIIDDAFRSNVNFIGFYKRPNFS